MKNKKSVLIIVIFIIVFAVILYSSRTKKETVFEDYTSAGENVRSQLEMHKEKFSLTCKTTDYNVILGATFVFNKILKEAFTHSGKPEQGDHLVLLLTNYEIDCYVNDNKDESKNLLLKVKPVYRTTNEQELELAEKAAEILRSLHIDGASDHDKALAIYRYICDNVTYDYSHLDDDSYPLQYSAYAAAIKGTAVCAGIADLFYYLANSAGLDARIKWNSTHAWNYVRVDGQYYYADATWDLGKSETEYEYFLKGSVDFENHIGNINLDLFDFHKQLSHDFLNYDISPWSYGYDPHAS
ncbi:MAG: hypothetical protein K6G90_11310 [Clostridia bacterium]|nr:hypothetical protein [Clostridia bacterium]